MAKQARAPSVASSFARILKAIPPRTKLIWTGEVIFVSGWSLLWADSLDLVHVIPIEACPVAMLGGLVLGGYAMRDTERSGLTGRLPRRLRNSVIKILRHTGARQTGTQKVTLTEAASSRAICRPCYNADEEPKQTQSGHARSLSPKDH